MDNKTMTQKVLTAISEALWQECPDRSAPESALIAAITIKVANVICEDYNKKILEPALLFNLLLAVLLHWV